MMESKKPKIAILSIRNQYNFGGVFATLKIVYDFCQQYFDPTVFYLSFDQEISASIKSFKFSSCNRSTLFSGMKAVEIGSRWAFWEPGHYSFTKMAWAAALKEFDYFFVVSATPLAGHPLALLDKKFVMWISTSYDQDRTERVKRLKGVRKFLDSLAHPCMKKIEKQILEKASFIWPLSQYSKKQFEDMLGKQKENSLVCGYPIDCEKIKPACVAQKKIIVSVGRFSDPRKNIAMLLKTFERIYQKEPEAQLYVIGQKPTDAQLKEFSGLASFGNIIFVGEVNPKD
ncbi:MAG: glycosyltransferase, partial [bacterium]